MQTLLKILAAFALILTITPPVLHCAGQMEVATVKQAMAASLILWFAAILPMRFAFKQRNRS